jgi:hypothetical protein
MLLSILDRYWANLPLDLTGLGHAFGTALGSRPWDGFSRMANRLVLISMWDPRQISTRQIRCTRGLHIHQDVVSHKSRPVRFPSAWVLPGQKRAFSVTSRWSRYYPRNSRKLQTPLCTCTSTDSLLNHQICMTTAPPSQDHTTNLGESHRIRSRASTCKSGHKSASGAIP